MFSIVTLSHTNFIGYWNRVNFKREFLVAFSLALITQTQLRITAFSAGLGELLILSLISYDMLAKLFSGYVKGVSSAKPENRWYNAIGFFGFIFFLIVLGPTVYHYYSYDPAIRVIAIHNSVAYLYAAFVFIYFCKFELNIELIAWLFGVSLLSIIIFEILILPNSSLFFEGARFTALSKNPNQLALAVLLLPFIFFRAIISKNTNIYRFFNTGCLIFSLVCIHLVRCDSIFIANLFLLFLGILFTIRRKKQIFYFVIPILILTTSLDTLPSKILAIQNTVLNSSFSMIIPDTIVNRLKKSFLANSKKSSLTLFESEAQVRGKLWRKAVTTSMQHPFLGVGAGGLVVLSEKHRVMEAHNTFLDISIQSGLTGLIFYLVFLLLVFIQINKKNRLDLLLMFYSIIMFSCFHFILRQPIVWFYFAYFLAANSDMTQKNIED